jgi:hypothetical protein
VYREMAKTDKVSERRESAKNAQPHSRRMVRLQHSTIYG